MESESVIVLNFDYSYLNTVGWKKARKYKKKVPFSFKNVLKRDKHSCQYCGNKATTIDHVHPKSKGGRNTFENCVAACKPCNHLKGNKMIYETNLQLKKQPYAPTLIQFLQLRLEVHGMAEVLKKFWSECNNI